MEKNDFIRRLKKAYKDAGLSTGHGFYTAVAERYGVTSQSPADWFNPHKGLPKIDMLIKIADDLGVSLDYLLRGQETVPATKNISVYAMSDAANRGSPISSMPTLDNDAAFAVQLEDDSMVDKVDYHSVYPEGAIVAFRKPNSDDPKNRDLVLALLEIEGHETVMFARHVTHAGRTYLEPLNERYEKFSGRFSVIGVFLYAVMR